MTKIRFIIGFTHSIYLSIRYFRRIKIKHKQLITKSLRIIIKSKGLISISENLENRGVSHINATGGKVSIGKNCFINNNVSITSLLSIQVGNNCSIANNVVIIDHDHDYRNEKGGFISKPISIGDNVWIGASCVILKGVNIGSNSVIAAGTIVNKDVPANSLVYQRRITIIDNVYKNK